MSDQAEKEALIQVGREFHARGWSRGTSSNYSAVLSRDPLRLLITASGMDKGALVEDDFVTVDDAGRAIDLDMPRPSAETLLHTLLARRAGAGAVLHTHSPWSTVLSNHFASPDGDGELVLTDYEMLKGLEGTPTHQAAVRIPIFDNTQDIADLAGRLDRLFDAEQGPAFGFLMRRHGLYTWGVDVAAARRHVEVLEFLFDVVGKELTISR